MPKPINNTRPAPRASNSCCANDRRAPAIQLAQRKLKQLAINDAGFVFDPASGATFSVNATGHAILEALKQGADRDHIAEQLQDRFASEGRDLLRDIDGFVHLLRTHQLLPADFSL